MCFAQVNVPNTVPAALQVAAEAAAQQLKCGRDMPQLFKSLLQSRKSYDLSKATKCCRSWKT